MPPPVRLCAVLGLVLAVAAAAPPPRPADTARTLNLEVGSGRTVTLDTPAANVFVADPKVAEVRPATPDTLFIFGVGPGRTNVVAMDAAGHLLGDYRVVVSPSSFAAGQAQAAVAAAVPGTHVTVRAQPKGMLLTGEVATPEEAARALAIARGFLSGDQTIEDQIGVRSSVQVSLQVKITEMSRSVTNTLGVNWQALGTIGRSGVLPWTNLVVNSPNTVACAAGTLLSIACAGASIDGVISALVQENLARILAEPNLTAMSGQPATFLAGGEFPIPVGQQNGRSPSRSSSTA
jgi:pilus assembly protein CpaC